MKNIIKCFVTFVFRVINCRKFNIETGKNCYLGCIVKGSLGGGKIGNNTSLKRCRFVFNGKNNKIAIGDNVRLRDVTFWFEDDDNEIVIGDNTTMEGNTQLAACEGTKIVIGNDCMFAHNVNFRTTDSHSVINEDGERINPAKDIFVGNHVWIGTDALILKGTNIPDNCIVSAKALVASHTYERNSIIGGVPARQIKCNVNWLRERI